MLLRGLLYLSFISLSLGQFTSVSKQATASIYLFDLVVGLFAVYGVFYFLAIGKSFKLPRNVVFFGLFTLTGLSSLLLQAPNLSVNAFMVSAFYLVRWVIYLTSALVISNMLDKKLITQRQLYRFIVFSCLFIAVAGFVQLIVLPDFETLDPSLGWDPHKNRLASTFFDPNFVGAFLVVGITVLLESFLSSNSKDFLFKKEIQFVLLGILILALVLTFSRSAWGMLAVIVLVYGVLKSRLLLLAALVVGFGAYFAVPRIQTRLSGVTDPADSAAFRLVSWNNTLRIIDDNWILGVGFNSFRFAQLDYGILTPDTFADHSGSGSDSSLLLVFATTGIFGLTFFILGWTEPLLRKKSVFLGALILGFLMESQFINSLFFPQLMFIYLPLLLSL